MKKDYTTQEISEQHGVPHNRLLQKIRQLKFPYIESYYLDKQNKKRTMYIISGGQLDKLLVNFSTKTVEENKPRGIKLSEDEQYVLGDYIKLSRKSNLYGEDVYDTLKFKYTRLSEYGKITILDYLIELENISYKRPALLWN